ncbi:MAG TPA: hypothetical protein VFA60_04115 [Terriglobales bacterium]|nr:hypothetical protein [Terriglobales bacterium]
MLPKIVEHGVAAAEEVRIETLGRRLRREAAPTGAPSIIAPHVVAWGRKE